MSVSLKNRLPEIQARLDSGELDAVILSITEMIAQRASALAPGVGPLRNSIEAKPITEASITAGPAGAQAGVFMPWYGIYPEHGTIYQPPQPFLVPAAEVSRLSAAATVATWLRTL